MSMPDSTLRKVKAIPPPIIIASTLFSFVGLNDSLLRDFTFKDVRTVRSQGGTVAGVGNPCPTQVTPPVWSCIYTHNFQFEGEILPPPSKDCLAGN